MLRCAKSIEWMEQKWYTYLILSYGSLTICRLKSGERKGVARMYFIISEVPTKCANAPHSEAAQWGEETGSARAEPNELYKQHFFSPYFSSRVLTNTRFTAFVVRWYPKSSLLEVYTSSRRKNKNKRNKKTVKKQKHIGPWWARSISIPK